MSQNLLLLYVPRAYPYMPYSASFVLKGHIEANSAHKVFCTDLNIEFYRQFWEGGFASRLPSVASFNPMDLLKVELLAELGPTAYAQCREEASYADLTFSSAQWNVLQLANEVIESHDKLHVEDLRSLPAVGESWSALIDRQAQTSASVFLAGIASAIELQHIDIVGFSVTYVEQIAPALLLASLLRRRKPGLNIVMGGGAITHILETRHLEAEFFEYADAAIPYEGEHSLLEYLDALDARTDRGNLRNVATWDAKSNLRIYQKDLGERPRVAAVPDFAELLHLYPTPTPVIPLLTSKGCYWGKCAYCVHHEGYGQGYFNFDETVFKESVRKAVALGYSCFNFVDEAIPPKMVKRFASLFSEIATEFPDVKVSWMAEGRAEKSFNDPDFVDRLKESGCRLLVSGIESGSQRVSDSMQKGIDLRIVEEMAQKCRLSGIGVGWMFFVGFPGETREEADETFKFISRNMDSLLFASVGAFQLKRGSPLFKDPGRWNIAIVDAKSGERIGFDYLDSSDKLRTKSDSRQLLRELLEQHTDLRPLMTTIPDRTAAFFMSDHEMGKLDLDFELTFKRDEGEIVTYMPFRKRCKVAGAAVGNRSTGSANASPVAEALQ